MTNKRTFGIWVYAFWPSIFLGICWSIWLYSTQIENIPKIGVTPRSFHGLIGIITHPFFHSTHLPDGSVDYNHIMNNSIPFLLLGTALFYHFKDLSYKISIWLFIGTGVWLWSFGRPSNHIGASGIVYALFGFLTISGFLKGNKHLLALSLLTLFLYGSMIWGIFPDDPKVSWEGHLSGFLIGVVLAFYFRKKGPSSTKTYISDDDSFNEWKFGEDYWKTDEQLISEQDLQQQHEFKAEAPIQIKYEYKPKEKRNE
ncbi:MAG: membrane associated rhomboid family serine protease [Flavobacteriales bacterium]